MGISTSPLSYLRYSSTGTLSTRPSCQRCSPKSLAGPDSHGHLLYGIGHNGCASFLPHLGTFAYYSTQACKDASAGPAFRRAKKARLRRSLPPVHVSPAPVVRPGKRSPASDFTWRAGALQPSRTRFFVSLRCRVRTLHPVFLRFFYSSRCPAAAITLRRPATLSTGREKHHRVRGTLHPGVIHHSPHDAAAVACRGQNQQQSPFPQRWTGRKTDCFRPAACPWRAAPCPLRHLPRAPASITVSAWPRLTMAMISSYRNAAGISVTSPMIDVLSLREAAQAGCARHAAHRGCEGNAPRRAYPAPSRAPGGPAARPGPRTRGHGPQQRLFALFRPKRSSSFLPAVPRQGRLWAVLTP